MKIQRGIKFYTMFPASLEENVIIPLTIFQEKLLTDDARGSCRAVFDNIFGHLLLYDKIFAVASSGTVQISKLSNGVYEYIARMRDFIAQCPPP